MKIKHLLLLILTVSFLAAVSGQTGKKFPISGQITVQIGSDTIPPNELMVQIEPIHTVMVTDPYGFFRSDSLNPGNYRFKILSNSYAALDTCIQLSQGGNNYLNFRIKSNCIINGLTAEKDIKMNDIKLYIAGGIAPIANSHPDLLFQEKYKVVYDDLGCDAMNLECIHQYNQQVFNYLDAKYGSLWRLQVRKDVVGI